MSESTVQVDQAKLLPQGWRWVKLGELGPVRDGDWILNTDYALSGVRLLQVADIGIGQFVDKSSRFVALDKAKELNCTFLEQGDILISRMPNPIGRACQLPNLGYACITAVDVSIWRPKPNIANRQYLTYYLNCSDWFTRVMALVSGTTRARISRSNLETLAIPLPSLCEQKRIAARVQGLIADVERAHTACEAQLEAAKALPSVCLRHVFESDEAKKWEKRRLGEVCQVIMGQSPPGHTYNEQGNGLPFLQGKIDFGVLYPTRSTWCTEPQKIAEPNDILISVRAPVGPTNLCSEKCCIGRGLAAIRAGKNAESRFILFYLRHIEKDILNIGQGSTFGAIKREHIEGIELPLPRLLTQNQVATELKKEMSQAENLRAAIEKQLDTIKALLQAILRKAFSGEL